MEEKDRKTLSALQCAYDMCCLVKYQADNVIASGDYSGSDVVRSKKATEFIDWFEGNRKFRNHGKR